MTDAPVLSSQPIAERLRQFLSLVPNAGWRASNPMPSVWNEQLREAMGESFIAIGFGGLLKLTDAGRAALSPKPAGETAVPQVSTGTKTLREAVARLVDPDAHYNDIPDVRWAKTDLQRRELAYQKADAIMGLLHPAQAPIGYIRIWDEPEISPDFYRDRPTTEIPRTKIVAVYAAPQPASNAPAGKTWTRAEYWQYVGGLAGAFEADQMRDTLAERGLRIVGIGDDAYEVLPCDVHLPVNTYIRKGVPIETLMTAIRAREKFPSDATQFPEHQSPPSLVKGTVYHLTNFGPAEYLGVDVYHGETTHQFRTSDGIRYIKPERLASSMSSTQDRCPHSILRSLCSVCSVSSTHHQDAAK